MYGKQTPPTREASADKEVRNQNRTTT